MLIKETSIMRIGRTGSKCYLSEEVVAEALERIKEVPIVYNQNQVFKDYNQDLQANYFEKLLIIGHVTGNAKIVNKRVLADVEIDDQYANLWHGHTDNWLAISDIDENRNFTALREILSFEVF